MGVRVNAVKPMTAAELIAELQKLPPQTEIWIMDSGQTFPASVTVVGNKVYL